MATAALNPAGCPPEADSDVAVPASVPASASVIRRVKGGIEFTEDHSMLWAYDRAQFRANVARHNTFAVGNQQMSGFRIGAGRGFDVVDDHNTVVVDNSSATLGSPTNEDIDVATVSANVKLTNDVQSAEWIIERHHVDVPSDTMVQDLKGDLGTLFAARAQLVSSVKSLQSGHAGEAAIAPAVVTDTNAAAHVFIYRPGANRGKAQITAMYTQEDTIRRINKLNSSKYLTGTKVADGEDIARISGTSSRALLDADIAGTTSFSSAERLLTSLRTTSLAIPCTVGGGNRLSQDQVGIVKLMVLNDALATTMVRYAAGVGQGQDKNIQRFFPKSRRDEYVRAITRADPDAGEMAALEAEILRTRAADAQALFDRADPTALRTDEAFAELAANAAAAVRAAKSAVVVNPLAVAAAETAEVAEFARIQTMVAAKQALIAPKPGVVADPAALLLLKTTVLGANGALLATWIGRAAHAYADLTPTATQHEFPLGAQTVGSVIGTSRGFTPLAAGDRGAIYEMREREIGIDKSGWFNVGSLDEITKAVETIFGSA